MTKLVTDKKKQFGPLVRWLKVNFSECFCAWIHVKALRVFVESVLRYGLPVNFQAILLRPNKKSTKRLRDVLNQLYAHLDSSATAGGSQSGNQDVSLPLLYLNQPSFVMYICDCLIFLCSAVAVCRASTYRAWVSVRATTFRTSTTRSTWTWLTIKFSSIFAAFVIPTSSAHSRHLGSSDCIFRYYTALECLIRCWPQQQYQQQQRSGDRFDETSSTYLFNSKER